MGLNLRVMIGKLKESTRLIVAHYFPIDDEALKRVVRLKLEKIQGGSPALHGSRERLPQRRQTFMTLGALHACHAD